MDSLENVKQMVKAAPVADPKGTAELHSRLGTVDIQIKDVDVSRPARAVNRMWPNR